MKKITQITVTMLDEDNYSKQETFFGSGGDIATDQFMNFLITEGFYDDIQVQKRFSVSKEVMQRLKGK